MSWHAQLQLHYRSVQGKTLLDFSHNGPLRILQSLYPEGEAICHNVLVHPPGGLAGGDDVEIAIDLAPGAHALVTTPGATRFYKTTGQSAIQRTKVRLGKGARLEWLPLENIAYSGCQAENRLQIQLAPAAQLIGWDVSVLGLPAAQLPFVRGALTQHLELQSHDGGHCLWLERGCVAAEDRRLMHSPLGMAGLTCWGTVFFMAGDPISSADQAMLLEASRAIARSHGLKASAGSTSPHAQVVVLRVLAAHAEEAMDLCKKVRAAWRELAWKLPHVAPRIWSM
jgi:urease accessory protein